jgi:cellulose 1,4-beta-cellobiosidase
MTMYIDAAHGGWLGWSDNMGKFIDTISNLGFDLQAIRGFATNVANYQPLGSMCPWMSNDGARNDYCLNGAHSTDPCCADPCKLTQQYNQANNELNYVNGLAHLLKKKVPSFDPHFIIDTGRNGVGGMRSTCANWCNPRGAGIGLFPTSNTAVPSIVDAYFWLKTPGESDGCTQTLPAADGGGLCPRYDSFCGSADSIGSRSGEPRAPEAGKWFNYQIQQLADNGVAQAPINGVGTDPCANVACEM